MSNSMEVHFVVLVCLIVLSFGSTIPTTTVTPVPPTTPPPPTTPLPTTTPPLPTTTMACCYDELGECRYIGSFIDMHTGTVCKQRECVDEGSPRWQDTVTGCWWDNKCQPNDYSVIPSSGGCMCGTEGYVMCP